MNIFGTWYPLGFEGRGLDIFDSGNGIIVAHYFGYKQSGEQAWLVCTNYPGGNKLQCWHTWSNANGPGHTESQCGTMTLTPGANGTLRVEYDADNLGPVPGFILDFERMPGTAPATPDITDKIIIRNEQGHDTYVPGKPVMCMGFYEHLPKYVTLEVLKGPVTVTGVSADGPWRPYVHGVSEGNILATGVKCRISFDCAIDGRDWSGTHKRVDFGVWVDGVKVIEVSGYVKDK